MIQKILVRTGYRVVFSGKYKEIEDTNEVFVDPHDKEDVYDMFHLYLCDPNVVIYVRFHDGTEKKVGLI